MAIEVCPQNGCDLRAGEISEESLRAGWYGPWDGVEKKYYSHVIGVEIRGLYDGVCYWHCPICGARWHRFEEPDSRRARVEAYWAEQDATDKALEDIGA